MPEPLLAALICSPLIVAAVAGATAWRTVQRPFLFLVVSALALLGLQAVISPVALASFLTFEAAQSRATANEAFIRSVAVGAAGTFLLGCPLLWWLHKGLRRGA